MPYQTYEEFLKAEFTWPSTAKFYQKTVLIQMDDQRIAKVELHHNGSGYIGFDVSIINKTTGLIDKTSLYFNDEMTVEDRADDRPDHKGGFIIGVSEIGWYIAVPRIKAKKRFMNKVLNYIIMWK
jgi:hypothetical protein